MSKREREKMQFIGVVGRLRRASQITVLAGGLAFGAAACGGSSSGSDSQAAKPAASAENPDLKGTITFGAIFPLTGGAAHDGNEQRRGTELAVDRINAEGGVLGKKLVVKFEDSALTQTGALEAAKKLTSVNKAPVILGEYISGNTLVIGKQAESVPAVHVNPTASSTELSKIGPHSFSVIGSDAVSGRFAAKTIYDAGYRKVAFFMNDNASGHSVVDSVAGDFEKLGGTIVKTIFFNPDKSDFRTELKQLKDTDAELYFYAAYNPFSLTINKQLFEVGLEPSKFFAHLLTAVVGTGSDPRTFEGMMGYDVPVSDDTTFVNAWKAKYGEETKFPYAPFVYDATMMAAAAVNEAGSTDPGKIRKALQKLGTGEGFDGVTGSIHFDENGQRDQQDFGLFVGKGGEIVPLDALPGPQGS
jgi:branched-chain amino acid transport system substrate-binding protein